MGPGGVRGEKSVEPQRPTPEQHLLWTLEALVYLLGTFTHSGSSGGSDLVLDTNISWACKAALGLVRLPWAASRMTWSEWIC